MRKRLLGCLLTVYAEQGAKSRADIAAAERGGTHYVIVDECQLFLSNSSAALNEMLSQTRKFGMFAVLSHQTRDQIPERMWGALQNVEVDITFRTGREDAEHQAKVVGSVDPHAVKHEVEEGQERSHPAFYSLPEQWEGWTQQIARSQKALRLCQAPQRSDGEDPEPPLTRSRGRSGALGQHRGALSARLLPAGILDAPTR